MQEESYGDGAAEEGGERGGGVPTTTEVWTTSIPSRGIRRPSG